MEIAKNLIDIAEQSVTIDDTVYIALGASSHLTTMMDRLLEGDIEGNIYALNSLKRVIGPFEWSLTMTDRSYKVVITSDNGYGLENFWPTAKEDDETYVRHIYGASANGALYCAVSCLALAYIKSHSKKANICQ